MGLSVARRREPWKASARVVSSRFPAIGLFDRVANPADLEAVYYIESLTNPRLREEIGELSLVAPEERVSGPGTTPIMAAFTHLNPRGSRFSDGGYGVYYAARALETAIRETVYHRERFMRDSNEPPMTLEMRVYHADLDARFHDIRTSRRRHAEWYDPDRYSASQKLGRTLREAGSWGIYYQSVRHEGGACAAVFRPKAISPVRQGAHLGYVWDGQRIATVRELRTVLEL